MTLPTPSDLREMFSYDEGSGILIWKSVPHCNPKLLGKDAGSPNRNGYRYVTFGNKPYSIHRLIWALVHGTWPRALIDHIDGNKSNNRLSNLREATKSQNSHNRKINNNNKSGIKGVSWEASRNSWRAAISVHRKKIWLGNFKGLEDAGAAILAARSKFHGEYARAR